MASGLGSPQLTSPAGGDGLAYYMCTLATSIDAPTVTGIEPDDISTASGGSVTVSGSNFEKDGVPDVSQVWVNNYLVSPSDVMVTSASQLRLNDLPSGTELVPTDPVNDGAGRAIVAVTLEDGATSPVTPASVLSVVDTTSGGSPSIKPAVTEVSTYGGPTTGGNHVTIFGSGFQGVDAVMFGGVAATTFDVVSGYELLATVPAYSKSSTTCTTSLSAADAVCQVQVVVMTASGQSNTYPISPSYEGSVVLNAWAALVPPPGCDCEVMPAPTEYDYFPPPRITSVSTASRPADYASEAGTSTVTITGEGLLDVGLNDILVGPATAYDSVDASTSYVSASEIQLTAPSVAGTVNPTRMPVSVETLGGRSNTRDVTYSGVPVVSSVLPRAVPDSGGAAVAVSGNGFSDATFVELVGTASSLSETTVYKFRVASNLHVAFSNPAQTSTIVHVKLCTTSGCSTVASGNEMTIYAPGNPVVIRSLPRSGPSRGGTLVTISGRNLGCTTQVSFGTKPATSFSNAPVPYLTCGSTDAVLAHVPPGRPGTTVPITIETAESVATGYGWSKTVAAATFTYARSAPSGHGHRTRRR